VNNIIDFAIPFYEKKDMMHGIEHIKRVIKRAKTIAKEFGVQTNDIEIAAYLHGFIYSHEEIIKDFLSSEFPLERVEKIIRIAWASQKDRIARTLEEKILHDAHVIEGGKTFLITKSLITGSLRGQKLEETIAFIEAHVLDCNTCYLESSKVKLSEANAFAKEFIKSLKEGLEEG
jgi:uncharacterized protein